MEYTLVRIQGEVLFAQSFEYGMKSDVVLLDILPEDHNVVGDNAYSLCCGDCAP